MIPAVCQGLLPTIRHLENRRGEGPRDEVEESTLNKDSSVPLMHYDPGDFGQICFNREETQKNPVLNFLNETHPLRFP